ncbi:hypothetical protein DPMN_090789 [Dreissena polymorpha]|uniref:Uncharacterized protein n=1 Tax=Dreissena polymorpha TaxID=45954 RepID=A0A9D4L0V5_DREPO|nr:hypothetical protein DPMN_090789 [Dreissena polymorpha]
MMVVGKPGKMVVFHVYFYKLRNRQRSPSDQRPTYFSAIRAGDRPVIARKPAQYVASGGVRINFKSHLKFYPTSGPGRRQHDERKKKSAADRTVLNFVNHRTADGSDVPVFPMPVDRTHRPATGLFVSEA